VQNPPHPSKRATGNTHLYRPGTETFQLHTLHISDILRAACMEDSQLGLRLKSSLESGELVPDDLITELIEREIAVSPGDFLLVDYPRTVNQCRELLELFRQKGIQLHTLWILELNDIEPLIASNASTANKLYQKFAEESEDFLRTRFQHANETIELIRQAFGKQIHIETITYNHPQEPRISEIMERFSNQN
jgi:adenylate kinase family enzyme